MLHHRVDGVRLLQLKDQLLHDLYSVVAAQVDHHLFDLKKNVKEYCLEMGNDQERHKGSGEVNSRRAGGLCRCSRRTV